jgi:hypothetical protein
MGDSNFDIRFTALPPDLQMKLWILGLDANTSKVCIAYRAGAFTTNLTYNYGGNVQAALSIRKFSTTLGVNPSSGQVDLGVVYQGFKFGSYANFTQKTGGLNLGYGAGLLPYPAELTGVFDSAAIGLRSLASDVKGAPNNPLAWYKLHSDDVNAVTQGVSAVQSIANSSSSDRFGVGLRINYTQQTGLTVYGGALLRF